MALATAGRSALLPATQSMPAITLQPGRIPGSRGRTRNQRHLLGNAPGAAAHGARDVGAMAIAVGGAPAVRDRGVARQDATAEIDVIGPDAGVDDEGGDVTACPQPVAALRIQRPVSLIDAIESQVAWLCAVRSAASDTVWSCSMACTFGLLLSRATAASGRVAAKPLIAAV